MPLREDRITDVVQRDGSPARFQILLHLSDTPGAPLGKALEALALGFRPLDVGFHALLQLALVRDLRAQLDGNINVLHLGSAAEVWPEDNRTLDYIEIRGFQI